MLADRFDAREGIYMLDEIDAREQLQSGLYWDDRYNAAAHRAPMSRLKMGRAQAGSQRRPAAERHGSRRPARTAGSVGPRWADDIGDPRTHGAAVAEESGGHRYFRAARPAVAASDPSPSTSIGPRTAIFRSTSRTTGLPALPRRSPRSPGAACVSFS